MPEQLNEIFARIHAGLRRKVKRGALLADETMHALHDRLLTLDTKALTQGTVKDCRFVVIDTETTGFKAYAGDEIVSISLIELEGVEPTGRELYTLVNPGREIPAESTEIHHITDDQVRDAPVIEEVLIDVADFIGQSVIVGHHVNFDIRFLNKTLQKELLCHLKHPWLDTMMMYLAASGRVGHYTLEEVAHFTRVPIQDRHTARGDALTTAGIFANLVEKLGECTCSVDHLIRRQYEFGQF